MKTDSKQAIIAAAFARTGVSHGTEEARVLAEESRRR